MALVLDIADLIAAAKYSGKSNHIGVGKGTLIVSKLTTFAGQGGPTAVAEFLVEDSVSENNKPGTTCSYVKVLAGKHAAFYLGLVKELFEVMRGEGPMEPTAFAKAFRTATGDTQPLRGMRIKYEGFAGVSKEKQTPVTNLKWLTYENTAESVASGLAALKSAGL